MGEKLITTISIAIVIVCLLIVFSLVGIINTIEIENPTTGFAASDLDEEQEDEEVTNSREETSEKQLDISDTKLYSEQAYGFFYFILIILILVIVIVGLAIVLPRFKKYT